MLSKLRWKNSVLKIQKSNRSKKNVDPVDTSQTDSPNVLMHLESQISRTSLDDVFEILIRANACRLEDQRSLMPHSPVFEKPSGGFSGSFDKNPVGSIGPEKRQTRDEIFFATQVSSKGRLQEALKHPPPYPQVILPPEGGFWMDPSPGVEVSRKIERLKSEKDALARAYREHFVGKEHFNLSAVDETLGPIIMSVRIEDANPSAKFARVILRHNSETLYKEMSGNSFSPQDLARLALPQLSATAPTFEPVFCPDTYRKLLEFDEQTIINKFKVGLIYQRIGQTTEEAMFSNQTPSQEMEAFMDCIGQRITLSGHTGYRGGLDTKSNQTGTYTLYEKYEDSEILFHVSTFLPFSPVNNQQLERKCHIGNDIVAIVFQEGNTPFTPDMIASNFLHIYIVVQPVSGGSSYKVTIAARDDVPDFGPGFPASGSNVIEHGPALKDFILAKIMNAEYASFKGKKLSQLELRTRGNLLNILAEDLCNSTSRFLSQSTLARLNSEENKKATGVVKTWKRSLSIRTRSVPLQPLQIDRQSANTSFNPQQQGKGKQNGIFTRRSQDVKSKQNRTSQASSMSSLSQSVVTASTSTLKVTTQSNDELEKDKIISSEENRMKIVDAEVIQEVQDTIDEELTPNHVKEESPSRLT